MTDRKEGINLGGTLPSGPPFRFWLSGDDIVLRVTDRICTAHKRWMTPAEARSLAHALLDLAGED